MDKKLKFLCSGKKGILLPGYPKNVSGLYSNIETYMKEPANAFLITFKDQEGDECEIINQETYEAALNEFSSKVTLKLIRKDSKLFIDSISMHSEKKVMYFFKKRSRSLGIFNLELGTIAWEKIPKGIVLKEYATWIDLPSGEIFYCGGGHPISSDEVYLINPITKAYKKLPNMIYPRHSHSIIYRDGFVYIFGGVENRLFYVTSSRKSERFNLTDMYWEEINELEHPISDVSSVTYENKIYLLGKGNQYIYVYDTQQSVINLEEDNGGCMAVKENYVFVFHGQFVKIYDLKSMHLLSRVNLPVSKSWWSHSPPVIFNNSIYFLWWEDPGWVCKFDINTNEFIKLKMFS